MQVSSTQLENCETLKLKIYKYPVFIVMETFQATVEFTLGK